MKIALVTPRFAPDIGGLETHVRELATRFANRGISVEVLTQTADRSLPREDRRDNLIIRRFPVVFRSDNYAVSWRLPLFIARNRRRYDLIHVHNYQALPALSGALLAGDRPVVFTPHYHGVGHSAFRSGLHRPYRLLGRRLFARSDQVICVSHAEASLVIRHFPAVAPKIEVIPNGVDTLELSTAEPFDGCGRVVLSVGRLESYKNVDTVIGAMSELDSSYGLRIVGEGPDEDRLRRQVTTSSLQSRVEFLKRVDRQSLCRWYRTASVYVNMSGREAFGISALEAIASGASVVLSDIPAHREILSAYGGDRGCLVRLPVNRARLAASIAAAEHGHGDECAPPLPPSWDRVAQETTDLYTSVIRRGHRLRLR